MLTSPAAQPAGAAAATPVASCSAPATRRRRRRHPTTDATQDATGGGSQGESPEPTASCGGSAAWRSAAAGRTFARAPGPLSPPARAPPPRSQPWLSPRRSLTRPVRAEGACARAWWVGPLSAGGGRAPRRGAAARRRFASFGRPPPTPLEGSAARTPRPRCCRRGGGTDAPVASVVLPLRAPPPAPERECGLEVVVDRRLGLAIAQADNLLVAAPACAPRRVARRDLCRAFGRRNRHTRPPRRSRSTGRRVEELARTPAGAGRSRFTASPSASAARPPPPNAAPRAFPIIGKNKQHLAVHDAVWARSSTWSRVYNFRRVPQLASASCTLRSGFEGDAQHRRVGQVAAALRGVFLLGRTGELPQLRCRSW